MEKYHGMQEFLLENKESSYDKRVDHLIKEIMSINLPKSIKALQLIMDEMNSEKGMSRHDGRDYFVHPVAVSETALDFNIISDLVREGDIEKADRILTVCLLHDAIEDIETVDKDLIVKEFGIDIANDVDNVTKRDGEPFVEYVQRFLGSDVSALVKSLDRLNNVATLSGSTDEHRARQLEETKNYYFPLNKIMRRRYWQYRKYFFQSRTFMDSILREITREQKTLARAIKAEEKVDELEKEIARLKKQLKK